MTGTEYKAGSHGNPLYTPGFSDALLLLHHRARNPQPEAWGARAPSIDDESQLTAT
jgi:hypothetical protein